jgi:hypothetical protein
MRIGTSGCLEPISDDTEWDELVSSSIEASPFLMSSFLRSIKQESSRFVLSEGGEAVIGTCIFNSFGSNPENPYAFCLYQGVLFPHLTLKNYSDENERLRRLKRMIECLDSKAERIHLSFHPKVNDLRAIEWFYYEAHSSNLVPNIKSRYTGLIEIEKFASFDEYLKSIRKERLREYKKSLETQYKVDLHSSDLENFLNLYYLTFDRKGQTVSDDLLNRVKSIISAGLMDGAGNLKMLYSEDGEPVSGAYILSDKGTDVYLFGANNTNYRDSYGSTRMILDSLKETFQESKKIFDFCGMNSPLRGEFKSSFNARLTPYFELDLNVRKGI